MRELLIEMPNYEGRSRDLNTIAALSSKHDLEYDALLAPTCTVVDTASKEVLLESKALIRCYISGEESKIAAFLNDLEGWFTDF